MISRYQQKIVNHLKNGSKLQSTEGTNYKTWLVHSDGSIEKVNRISANIICDKYGYFLD